MVSISPPTSITATPSFASIEKPPSWVSAAAFGLLPSAKSFSNTVSSPAELPMPKIGTPSSLPLIVMVRVAGLGSPSASCIV